MPEPISAKVSPNELADLVNSLPWIHTYVLDANEQPVKADVLRAGIFHEKHWMVARDRVGAVEVSTVFLGSDVRLGRSAEPVLWETALITTEEGTCPVERYTSAKAAREGHARIVADLQKNPKGV